MGNPQKIVTNQNMSWEMPGSNILKRNQENTLPAIPSEF